MDSYKGVTYREGKWWVGGAPFLSEEDYAALMALKERAESVVRVEDVVCGWWTNPTPTEREALQDLCARLRTAFPHIDQKPPVLTAAEHVEALVQAGAIFCPKGDVYAYPYAAFGAPLLVLTPSQATEVHNDA